MDDANAQDMFTQTSPASIPVPVSRPLWELGITELAGRNLESSGRNDVNEMLQNGWILLHIYTLRYPEREGPRGPRFVWRERPMAILGRKS